MPAVVMLGPPVTVKPAADVTVPANVGASAKSKVTAPFVVVAVKFASFDVTLWIAVSALAMLALVAADKSTA